MRAGRLDRRVTFQMPVESQSDSGDAIVTWNDLATVWAELMVLPGSERYVNQQIIGRAIQTFRIRYTSVTKQLTVEGRAIMDNRIYDITDVRETERREEIQVDCFTASEQPISSTIISATGSAGGAGT